MREIWLHTNRRAIALGMLLPGGIVITGGALALTAWWLSASAWWVGLGAVCAIAGAAMLASLGWWLSTPRLAYEGNELVVFLDRGQTVRVPIDIVECFFLGQGASFLPPLEGREPETANVIVRLAESAVDWKHRDVNPRIAHWCEGYVTLRGAWCEPIDAEGLRRLNHRLAEIHRQRKAATTSAAGQSAAAGAAHR